MTKSGEIKKNKEDMSGHFLFCSQRYVINYFKTDIICYTLKTDIILY